LWTSGLFARDVRTGEAVWFYQMSPHDRYDYDGVNENLLIDLPGAGARARCSSIPIATATCTCSTARPARSSRRRNTGSSTRRPASTARPGA
jgi:hypothetical protein